MTTNQSLSQNSKSFASLYLVGLELTITKYLAHSSLAWTFLFWNMIESSGLCRRLGWNIRGLCIGFGSLDHFLPCLRPGLSFHLRHLRIIRWTRTQKMVAFRLRRFHQTSLYFQNLYYKDVPVHLIKTSNPKGKFHFVASLCKLVVYPL